MIDYTGRWLVDNLPGEYSPSLVHNDFRNGNIMFDQQGIVAVLDWEVAHIGDPVGDLGTRFALIRGGLGSGYP